MCLLCFATSLPRRKSNPLLKWSAFFFSFFCLLAGILVIALTLILSFKTSFSYVFFNDNDYYGVLLGCGAALTIVGIFGCIGSLAESNCLLYTFSLFMFLLIAGEIAAGVIVYKNVPEFVEKLQSDIRQGVEFDYGENTAITSRIDAIQQGWSCCGTSSPSSWSKSKYGSSATKHFIEQRDTYFIPSSCCINENSKDCADTHRMGIREKRVPTHLHQEGCLRMLSESVNSYQTVAFIVLTAIIVCQLIAVILALVQACLIGKMHRTQHYISREQYEAHQASAPMLSGAPSMDSHKMFGGMSSAPSSVNVSKSSLNLEPATLEKVSKSSLV